MYAFVDEQKSLLPILRIAPYAVTKWEKRVVYNGYITVNNKKYSIPYEASVKEVRIKWTQPDSFEVWDHESKLTEYKLNEDPNKKVIYRPEHIPKIKGAPEQGDLGLATSPHVQKAPTVETRSLEYYERFREEGFPYAVS